MTSTSTPLSVKQPLDPLTIAVMREVDALLDELELPYFLCGAMARDVLLQNLHGIETGIATRDVDFGVALKDWQQFQTIKDSLVARGGFNAAPKIAQRLYYKPGGKGAGYPLDIIPFGGVEAPPNSITWPPDSDQVLNVTAYKEALATSIKIQVSDDLVVPVISLPALTLLKLFAWEERGNTNPKDALDLVLLMRTYHEAGNQDRLYGDEVGLLEGLDFDLEAASPELLGRDVRSIATPETLEKALAILNNSNLTYRLTTHMAPRLLAADDPVATAERLLIRFKAGLTEN